MNNATPARERDYWLCQLAGWGMLTVVAVLSTSFGDWEWALRFAIAKTFCMLTGLGLSHLWRGHLQRRGWFDRARALPFARIAAGLLVLSSVQTVCLVIADLAFRHGQLFEDNPTLAFDIVLLAALWFVVFAIWTLCYAVALARRRASRFELEKLQLEVSIKDAELRALQSQVNPHFFFNSLNSIRALIYEDADAAARAVNQLAGMMRHNLQADRAACVRLSDEMAAVRAYLDMEKLRFDDRLQLEVDIDPALAATPLPPLVLQTLVENAVKHGVERATGPCRIRITATRTERCVQIEVANEGRLAPTSSSTRMGLANAAQRLALQFGPDAGCTLAERSGWVCATVSLPSGVA